MHVSKPNDGLLVALKFDERAVIGPLLLEGVDPASVSAPDRIRAWLRAKVSRDGVRSVLSQGEPPDAASDASRVRPTGAPTTAIEAPIWGPTQPREW
jgi:hypothetical protein